MTSIPQHNLTQKRWLDLLEPVVLILLMPVMLLPNGPQVSLMLALPAVWLWQWQRTGQPIRPSPLNGSILLLVVMMFVSLFVTYSLAVSLPKIVGLVYGLGVYFAVIRVCDRPRVWTLGLGLFCVLGLGAAIVGLLGAAGLAYSGVERWRDLIDRLLGLAQAINPNEVAGALLWVIGPALATTLMLFRYHRTIRRFVGAKPYAGVAVVFSALSVAILVVLVLTLSRASYLAVLVTSWILLAIEVPPRWRWVWWSVSIIGVSSIVMAVALNQIDGNNRLVSAAVGSVNDRLEIYSRALFFFQNFSWTGMGMNTFVPVTHTFFPMERIGPQQPIGDAHNEYLQAGLDLGFPGLIAFLAVNLGAASVLWQTLKARRRQAQRSVRWDLIHWLTLGLSGGLGSHLIYGLADAVALGAKVGFMFWMMLGLISGLYDFAVRRKNG